MKQKDIVIKIRIRPATAFQFETIYKLMQSMLFAAKMSIQTYHRKNTFEYFFGEEAEQKPMDAVTEKAAEEPPHQEIWQNTI